MLCRSSAPLSRKSAGSLASTSPFRRLATSTASSPWRSVSRLLAPQHVSPQHVSPQHISPNTLARNTLAHNTLACKSLA